MDGIGEQGGSPELLTRALPPLSWHPVDSWIARYLQPNGQIIALRMIVAAYSLPEKKREILSARFRELREAGYLTQTTPQDMLMIHEASPAFRESARIHTPRISWRFFHPEELPV